MSGLKEDDLGLNSQLMWLRGDALDRGIQPLNLHGIGVAPWMQPRLDASMVGLQPEIYQAMAAAALQEMRTVDPAKAQAASLLQFQQTQNLPNRPATFMSPQMLQQPQPHQTFIQNDHEIQHLPHSQAPTQPTVLRQEMKHQTFNNEQQQQQQQQQQPQQQVFDHQQIPSSISTMTQFGSVSQSLQTIPSFCRQQSFSDSNGIHMTNPIISPLHSLLGSFPQDESSQLLNLPRTHPMIHSSTWPSKRAAIDPHISSGNSQFVHLQEENMGTAQANISQNVSLPPFPGRECSLDQRNGDPQSNLLFGVNIEPSSLLMQNGMPNIRGICSDSDSTAIPFSSNYVNTAGTNFSANPAGTPSNCIEDSGILPNFVKVVLFTEVRAICYACFCFFLFSYLCFPSSFSC